MAIWTFIFHNRLMAIGRALFRFSKMGIWRDSTGPTLYPAWKQSSQPTAQFRPSWVHEPAGGKPPANISERFLQVPIGWVGVAWSCRFRGGSVLSYRWCALGVGFGRPSWRRFRVNNVGARSVLVSGVPIGGCFASIMFAIGVGFQKKNIDF